MAAAADREDAVEIKRRARSDGRREGYDDGLRRADAEAGRLMQLADADRAEAARQVEVARAAGVAALERVEKLDAELERLEQEPEDFKLFLDTPLKDGKTMRATYNRVIAPVRERRARRAALLDEVRQEARRDAGHSPEL